MDIKYFANIYIIDIEAAVQITLNYDSEANLYPSVFPENLMASHS